MNTVKSLYKYVMGNRFYVVPVLEDQRVVFARGVVAGGGALVVDENVSFVVFGHKLSPELCEETLKPLYLFGKF